MRSTVEQDVALSMLTSRLDRAEARLNDHEKKLHASIIAVQANHDMVDGLRRAVASETTVPVDGILTLTRADVELLDRVLVFMLQASRPFKDSDLRLVHQKILEALK